MSFRRLVIVLFAVAMLGAPVAGRTAPALLSTETPPPLTPSTYGSGNFGEWELDEFGLPAFRYDLDQVNDPRAESPELYLGKRQAAHQLGNDHITAFTYNDGFTQLWTQDRISQWTNRWNAEANEWSGGYGYLHVDGDAVSTLWLDRPEGAVSERRFGTGYARHELATHGLAVREEVYAPFGDDPLLLHDVTIRNDGPERDVSWFEYWDVNPINQVTKLARITLQPRWDPATRTLTVAQGPDNGDLKPMSIFAAALEGPVDGFDTSALSFFGVPPSRQAPKAVLDDKATNSVALPWPGLAPPPTVLTFRSPLHLTAGQSVTLRYAYGTAHAGDISGLVSKYAAAADPFAASQQAWSAWVPHADFGASNAWVARELQWSAYLLRSASVYEEECGAHTITQGGYYQYGFGLNLGYRSWLHYLLPMVYTEPELAREILRYSIKLQPELLTDGFVPYGSAQLCTRFDLGTSNDLDVWLLMAAAEYGLGMRDAEFFDEKLPYYDTKRLDSAWEHIKRSYRHQESMRGPNGGYIMGLVGDWSDFSTQLGPMTESMLVAAQLAYVYPKLADLAELRGDDAFAAELRARGEELRQVTADNWTGKGWFARGYFVNRQIGEGMPYGEPQPWGLLSGAATPDQAVTLVANIRRFLSGVGAPGGPSPIGSAMAPARNDPDITETGPAILPNGSPDPLGPVLAAVPNAPLAGAAAYPGGVWYDINGWLVWALGEQEGIVPNARELAWDEYTRNTLAAHANAYPDHWNGTINVDDACSAWYSSTPDTCGVGFALTFMGAITEHPTWMVMDALRLAGVTPTLGGFHIDPHLPMEEFTVRAPRAGVATEAGLIRGYLRPERGGVLEMEVVLPESWPGAGAVASVDGQAVATTVAGNVVRFLMPSAAGVTVDWAVTAA
ncbi:MAG: GH36-type glycosyl hydrolase domain-containing protein [Actinomycetota bacterium]